MNQNYQFINYINFTNHKVLLTIKYDDDDDHNVGL